MLSHSNNKRAVRSRHLIAFIVLIAILIGALSSHYLVKAASNTVATEVDTDSIIDDLDSDELSELLNGLDIKQLDIFGGNDFIAVVKNIASGNFQLDYSNILSILLSIVGTSLADLIYLLVSIIAISVTYSLLGSVRSNSSSATIEKVVHFAATSIILVLVGSATLDMFSACRQAVDSMSAQINTIFPILLTIMAVSGASTTAAVYQPTVAILSSGIFSLISVVAFPMLVASFAFSVVGSVSGEIKLDKMSEFLHSAVKWLFGTAFFLLSAFMSLQGITASVFDGISVRSAKLTISKYVPVIGGYLSDGLNLIISGSILVKNSLGYAAVILLAVTAIPVIIQIAVYSLCMKLAAAAVEPLGNKLISDLLTNVSKTAGLTAALMIGLTFLYFVFIILIILTGNISI